VQDFTIMAEFVEPDAFPIEGLRRLKFAQATKLIHKHKRMGYIHLEVNNLRFLIFPDFATANHSPQAPDIDYRAYINATSSETESSGIQQYKADPTDLLFAYDSRTYCLTEGDYTTVTNYERTLQSYSQKYANSQQFNAGSNARVRYYTCDSEHILVIDKFRAYGTPVLLFTGNFNMVLYYNISRPVPNLSLGTGNKSLDLQRLKPASIDEQSNAFDDSLEANELLALEGLDKTSPKHSTETDELRARLVNVIHGLPGDFDTNCANKPHHLQLITDKVFSTADQCDQKSDSSDDSSYQFEWTGLVAMVNEIENHEFQHSQETDSDRAMGLNQASDRKLKRKTERTRQSSRRHEQAFECKDQFLEAETGEAHKSVSRGLRNRIKLFESEVQELFDEIGIDQTYSVRDRCPYEYALYGPSEAEESETEEIRDWRNRALRQRNSATSSEEAEFQLRERDRARETKDDTPLTRR